MSVNVNLEDYQIAQELLDSSQELFESTSNEVNSVVKTLDRKVLAYVEKDLNNAGESIHLLKANEADISGEITTHASKIVDIEGKAMQDLAAITGATEVEETEKQTHHVWDEGKEALSSLGDVALSVTKSLVSVGAAAVKGAFSLLTFNLGGLFDSCKTVLDAAVNIGSKVVSFVKESFDFLASFFASAVASIGNLFLSLVEGLVSFVEAIVDAAAVVAGVVASALVAVADGVNWVCSKLFGYEFKSFTGAAWSAIWSGEHGIMPFIGTNWTGKAFDALYTVPPFKWMETYAFGPFKREGGIVYEIGKGVGYTIGIVAATIATCGIAGGTSVVASLGSTGVSTAFAGLGAMGKNTQKGYNNLSEEEKQDGWSLFKVGAYGVGSGLVEAGAWYLTFGGGKGTLLKNQKVNDALGGSANWLNKVFGLSKNSSFMFKAGNMEKAVVQIGKTYANATNKYIFLTDDQSVGGYFKDVWLNPENAKNATIAAGVSLLYDATAGNYLKTQLEGKAKVDADGNTVGKDGYLTKLMDKLKTTENAPKTSGEQILPTGTDSAQDAIGSAGLGARMKDATVDVVSQGGASKIYNNLPKKFFDYRNILELFATG